jgi:hypothetical protein
MSWARRTSRCVRTFIDLLGRVGILYSAPHMAGFVFGGDTCALLARVPGLDLVGAQDSGLMHTPDPNILAWTVGEGRIVLTHDRNTMTGIATTRASAIQPMPGIFVVDR